MYAVLVACCWQEECLPFMPRQRLQLSCGLSSCWRWSTQYILQEEHCLTSLFWNNDVSFRYLLFTFVSPHTKIFIHKMLTSWSRNSGLFPVQVQSTFHSQLSFVPMAIPHGHSCTNPFIPTELFSPPFKLQVGQLPVHHWKSQVSSYIILFLRSKEITYK